MHRAAARDGDLALGRDRVVEACGPPVRRVVSAGASGRLVSAVKDVRAGDWFWCWRTMDAPAPSPCCAPATAPVPVLRVLEGAWLMGMRAKLQRVLASRTCLTLLLGVFDVQDTLASLRSLTTTAAGRSSWI
jgi:hypothetical protein